MKESSLDLSVVIPCYNEEDILFNNLKKIMQNLDKCHFKYEIILVDDCSTDKTVEIAKDILKIHDHIKLICHNTNMGRGKAVEDGIKASRGKIAGFLDVDLQVPAHYITPLAIEIEKGADAATALRVYDVRFGILDRIIASKVYHLLFDIALKTGIKDSETGYKFFNRERILPVLDEIRDKKWFWDTEVMTRAHLKGYCIVEVPCLCIRYEVKKSTVKLFRDSMRYLVNLWKFKKEVDNIRRKSHTA